jgi:hypothetical protein
VIGEDSRPSENHIRRSKEVAAILIPVLREVARQKGYAMTVHGSLERDIDLVAVPWRDLAVSPDSLIRGFYAVCAAVFGHVTGPGGWTEKETYGPPAGSLPNPERRPHGRLAWSILLGGGPYLDISIMPTIEKAEASPTPRTDRRRGLLMTNRPHIPELLPVAPPPKPHPIDLALAALSQLAAELLTGNRPSRFAELHTVSQIAVHIQRLRPDPSLGDMGLGVDAPMHAPNPGYVIQPGRRMAAFNDGVDLNREIVMLGQSFLEKFMELEKAKTKPADSRLREVTELSELIDLRTRIDKTSASIPSAIQSRIDHLLTRIGAPHEPAAPDEPASDPVVHPEPVRGHPPDGAGEPDRG